MPDEASGRSDTALRIQLLGGFRVWVGDREIPAGAWRLRKVRSLVKLLALSPGRRLHREQLLEYLWPALAAEAGANNLHQTLRAARRALAPPPNDSPPSAYLHFRDDVLTLQATGSLWLDVAAFEAAAAAARGGHDPAAYRAALALYAGELLPEDRYEDWTTGRRETLRKLLVTLLDELAGLYVARGEAKRAIETLQQVVAAEPSHEPAHLALMRLLALTGRRAQALRQYDQLQTTLQQELAVDPEPASQRLHEAIQQGSFPARTDRAAAAMVSGLAAYPNNLPVSLTSFVGRKREQAAVRSVISGTDANRLVTLTGPGGSGKTRLALEVARDLRIAYPDGIWLTELAPLTESALVPQAVAGILGLGEEPERSATEVIVGSLRDRQMLLVLDNCEHLLDGCATLIVHLLRGCPRVQALATSRAALNVPGEAVWPVPPLSLPEVAPTLEQVAESDAVQLFSERARLRNPSFVLTAENAPTVVQLCRRLDGLPLAIELAAARTGVLSVTELAERVADRFGVLTTGSRSAPSRQRTLRATVDWSYGLLTPQEQRLLQRLAVFRGGWTLDAVESVCAGHGVAADEVLDLLSRLVDQSLVVAEAASPS